MGSLTPERKWRFGGQTPNRNMQLQIAAAPWPIEKKRFCLIQNDFGYLFYCESWPDGEHFAGHSDLGWDVAKGRINVYTRCIDQIFSVHLSPHGCLAGPETRQKIHSRVTVDVKIYDLIWNTSVLDRRGNSSVTGSTAFDVLVIFEWRKKCSCFKMFFELLDDFALEFRRPKSIRPSYEAERLNITTPSLGCSNAG